MLKWVSAASRSVTMQLPCHTREDRRCALRTSARPFWARSALFFAHICALTVFSSVAEAAPTISGTPKTTFGLNGWYSFQPIGKDPEVAASTLRYSIVNKPAWAYFSTTTGKLEGPTGSKAGTYSNILISVKSSTGTASLPAFALKIGGTSGGGTHQQALLSSAARRRLPFPSAAPTVSNPTGSDPEGRTLAWSITNKPSWASFSTTTGVLTGKPTASNVGTTSNITIAASDGTNKTSLKAFAIAVNAAGSSTGSASLSWTPPTTTTSGATLTNLAGYRIYYGTSASSLSRTVQVSGAGNTRYVVSDLSPATYYFSIRAYTTGGTESAASSVVSKAIR